MLDITVQLNTNITNEVDDARVVTLEDAALEYQDGGIMLNANNLSFANDTFTVTMDSIGGGHVRGR